MTVIRSKKAVASVGKIGHEIETRAGDTPYRTLLVGLCVSVGPWCYALQATVSAPVVVGCLLPGDDMPSQNNEPAQKYLPAVLGRWDELEAVVSDKQIDQVLLTVPVAMLDQARVLAKRIEALGVTWRFLPCVSDQLAGRCASALKPANLSSTGSNQSNISSASTMLVVDPASLIAREPRALDHEAIRNTLAGKVVLITGSGGSIGSEIARLVAGFSPAKIVLVERSENALFDIDRQIARLFPSVPRSAALHDVTNASRTLALIMAHKPQVIFHAAAHKHVPMMEEHPADAVENNFYGTRSIADAAAAHGVERFVMISSDKAVNPSSVMGATKRLAELYIQDLNRRSDTIFSMVRFGNVLGSACSVIPIWSQQLAHGGPVTVTSSEMVRYFMTIPEAAGLVLQSAALSGQHQAGSTQMSGVEDEAGSAAGEVFLLDMGKPIRILDLAKRFIQAQGLEPGVDMQIQITGVRPGEKLFEELAYSGEDMLPTAHESIHLWRSAHAPDSTLIQQIVQRFDHLRSQGDAAHPWQHAGIADIHAALHEAIPEMVTPATDLPRISA